MAELFKNTIGSEIYFDHYLSDQLDIPYFHNEGVDFVLPTEDILRFRSIFMWDDRHKKIFSETELHTLKLVGIFRRPGWWTILDVT
jgi:hypothetical protein